MSDPDQDLLLFAAAHEVILAPQAAALLNLTEAEAEDRVEALCSRRLITRVQLSSQLPVAYRPTRQGAAQIDSYLPPLRALDWTRYRHEITTGWLWVSARHGRLGDLREVLTRREMQAADTTLRSEGLLNTTGATFIDPANRSAVDARLAYPDLALVQATGGWATLDVLLSLPEPERINRMISRLKHDRLMLAQLYLVEDDEQIDTAIRGAAQDLGLTDRVHVQELAQDGIAGA